MTIHNPHDETLVADDIQVASQADVDAAVAAARAAFQGPWSETPPQERSKLMHKLADLIEANADEVAQLETQCMGMPMAIAKLFGGLSAGVFRCAQSSPTEP